MDRDGLKDLLREADADWTVPTPRDDLSQRVLLLAARRRRQRVVFGSVAAGLLLAVALWSGPPDVGVKRPALSPDTSVAATREKLRAIEREIETRVALMDGLAVHNAVQMRLVELADEAPSEPDPIEAARSAVQQAAFVLVKQGDQTDRKLGRRSSAAESYRLAAALFPQTKWAGVAQQRLNVLD